MQLITRPIDDLTPAPYNPRVPLRPGEPGFEKLRRSLEEFDLVQPIVWNRRTGHVVGGHQRLEVLREAGRTEVECVVVDLPLEREQALNVALNNHAVGSDWDPVKLVDLLEELQQLSDFDPTLTGFDEQQLADLVLVPDPDPPTGWGLDEQTGDVVRVVLEVPPECWEEVEAALDELLAAEPQVKLHVTGCGIRHTGCTLRGVAPASLSPGGRGTALGAQRPRQGEGDERAGDVEHSKRDERTDSKSYANPDGAPSP